MEVGGGGGAVVAEGAAGDRAARKDVSEVGRHAVHGVEGVAAYAERVRFEGVAGWALACPLGGPNTHSTRRAKRTLGRTADGLGPAGAHLSTPGG